MRHRLPLPAAPAPGPARWPRPVPPGARLAAAVVAAAVAGLPVAAASASGPAGPSGAPVTGGHAAAATVPLITGGQVVVTTAGGRSLFLVRGVAGVALSYKDAAGDRFIVPAVAVPYLGKQLSPSLFDVSALARDGITGGARIPVTLRFAPGARATAPPGVTLTWARGQVAGGYVTAASGQRLDAALGRQDSADTVGGHLTAAGRLFGGLTAMTLAAPGAPVPPRPDYPLYLLVLKVTDETGKPANNAFVELGNTDNVNRELLVPVPVNNGVARVAVPAGDYSLIASFFENTISRTVVRNDFRVTATSKTTTVALAERSATSAVSVSVPRPARAKYLESAFWRASAAGGGFGLDEISAPVPPTYVNTQPAAKVGRLRYLEHWAGGPGGPLQVHGYVYEAAFAFRDIPADEHFVVRSSQIATEHEHFFADPASRGEGGWADELDDPAFGSSGQYAPGLLAAFYLFPSAAMPGNLTVYVGTASGDQWLESTENSTAQLNLFDDPHTFLPGRSYSLDWQHGPLAPTLGQHTGPWRCFACTAGRTLVLKFPTFGDSEPDHFSVDLGDQPHVRFTLYRDGTKLLSSTSAGAVVRNIPARPSTYRGVLDVSLAGWPGVSQSTETHTDLTVRYAPGGGAVLPTSDTCAGRSPASPCRVLPALTLGYQLATNSDNTSSSATQVLHLRVGHVSYNGVGSHAPITSAAVRVSFDGGKTWQRASLTGSDGSYTATWPNPASARGTSPDIKVAAADAAGGSITQTITNAYTIATTGQHRSSR